MAKRAFRDRDVDLATSPLQGAAFVPSCSLLSRMGYEAQSRAIRREVGFAGLWLVQIGFEAPERQRVITRCALSVKRQESGTVIRSTSVVLIELRPLRRSIAHQTHCLLGRWLPLRVVCPNKVGSRAGVAQSVERQPSKSNAPERGALFVESTHETPISCQVKRST